jgi:hypothetical protein
MKKLFFVTALLFSAVSFSSAQAIKTGFNFVNMGNEKQYAKSKVLARYQLGFEFKGAELSDRLSLKPEILLSWQGQNFSYEETFNVFKGKRKIATNYKDKLTYFQLPLLLEAKIMDNLLLEFGPSVGLLLSAKRSGETIITDSDSTGKQTLQTQFSESVRYGSKDNFPDGQVSFNKRPVSTFDAALNLGGKYKITDNIGIGVRYSYGLTDVFKNNYPFKGASSGRQVNKYLQVSVLYYFGSK